MLIDIGRLETAKEDIVCYGIAIIDKKLGYITTHPVKSITIGKICKAKMVYFKATKVNNAWVCDGLLMFVSLDDAITVCNLYGSKSVVVECLILCGSEYYKGKYEFKKTYVGYMLNIVKYCRLIE